MRGFECVVVCGKLCGDVCVWGEGRMRDVCGVGWRWLVDVCE